MRLIVGMFVVMSSLVAVVYIFLFTSIGHSFILPKIETSLEKKLQISEIKFTRFSLSTNAIEATLTLQSQPVYIKGKFNLFKKIVDIDYTLDLEDISIFNTLLDQKLQGKFQTTGKAIGNIENIAIQGDLFFANGGGEYQFYLTQNSLRNITFSLNDISLEKLLWSISKPQYIKGILTTKGEINSPTDLTGKIQTQITQGSLNKTYLSQPSQNSTSAFSVIQTFESFLQYSITQEIFEIDLVSDLQDPIINNDLTVKSENIQAKSEKLLINTKASTIEANINIALDSDKLNLQLQGDLKNPHSQLSLQEETKEKIKNKIIEKLGPNLENILESFLIR